MVSKRFSQRETPSACTVLTRKHADLLHVLTEFTGHKTADGEILSGHYGQLVCGLPVDI